MFGRTEEDHKNLFQVLTLLASEMWPRVDLPEFRWQWDLLKIRHPPTDLHGVTSQNTSDITRAILLCLKWEKKAHCFEAAQSNALLYNPEATIWWSHRCNYVYSWCGATEAGRHRALGQGCEQLLTVGSDRHVRTLVLQESSNVIAYRGRRGTAPLILNLGVRWGEW